MKFLLPFDVRPDERFGGIMTRPKHMGIPQGILEGMPWAADNGCFNHEFDEKEYFAWLEKMEPYRRTCLFIVVPDKVGDSVATLELFYKWRERFEGWPLAFVAQDGQEKYELPTDETLEDFTDWIGRRWGTTDEYPEMDPEDNAAYFEAMREYDRMLTPFDVLFIGGSTEWKESSAAIETIKRGLELGKRVHIGRVNYWRRYFLFRQIGGSDEFTCDGTRNRYDGIDKTVRDWLDYQARPVIQIWV